MTLSSSAIAACVLVPIAFACIEAGILAAIRSRAPPHPHPPPPSRVPLQPWVIGVVWTVLLGLMGAALASTLSYAQSSALPLASVLICFLMCLCLAYPLYTSAFSDPVAEQIGNGATLVLAFGVVLALVLQNGASRLGGALLVPLLAWLAFVNVAYAK